MAMLSVGDLAQSFLMTRQSTALKSELQRLSNEVTTGVAADAARHLGGDFGALAGIDTSLARLAGYKSVTTDLGLFAGGMQAALGLVDSLASDLGQSLLAGATTSPPSRIDALGVEAAQKLESVVSGFNALLGDRSLFAGTATATTPLPNAGALLTTLEGIVASARTADEVDTALTEWFAAPTGFAVAYRGGPPMASVSIGPGEAVHIDITAADPAVRDTLKGIAMAALLDRGILADQPSARAAIVKRSGEILSQSQTDRSLLTARLGTFEAQIDRAAQRNSAEASALQIARSDLLSVDGYEAASRLQQTETQLETLYTLTARLSRLNLVNFL